MRFVHFPRPLAEITKTFGRFTPAHEAIPGDRPAQIAVLAHCQAFAAVPLANLTDAQIELATFLAMQLAVVSVDEEKVRHGKHSETGLAMVVALGPGRSVTMIALPCGEGGPTDLRL